MQAGPWQKERTLGNSLVLLPNKRQRSYDIYGESCLKLGLYKPGLVKKMFSNATDKMMDTQSG